MGAVEKENDPSIKDGSFQLAEAAPYKEWSPLSRCIPFGDTNPDFFFKSKSEILAKIICNTECKVRTHCLNYAIDNELDFGIWGGMTPKERRELISFRSRNKII